METVTDEVVTLSKTGKALSLHQASPVYAIMLRCEVFNVILLIRCVMI